MINYLYLYTYCDICCMHQSRSIYFLFHNSYFLLKIEWIKQVSDTDYSSFFFFKPGSSSVFKSAQMIEQSSAELMMMMNYVRFCSIAEYVVVATKHTLQLKTNNTHTHTHTQQSIVLIKCTTTSTTDKNKNRQTQSIVPQSLNQTDFHVC